jgi:acetyl-CoA carboxylase carboxyl transferase subunit alpha
VQAVGKAIEQMLGGLKGQSREKLLKDRRAKFMAIGSKGLAA